MRNPVCMYDIVSHGIHYSFPDRRYNKRKE